MKKIIAAIILSLALVLPVAACDYGGQVAVFAQPCYSQAAVVQSFATPYVNVNAFANYGYSNFAVRNFRTFSNRVFVNRSFAVPQRVIVQQVRPNVSVNVQRRGLFGFGLFGGNRVSVRVGR